MDIGHDRPIGQSPTTTAAPTYSTGCVHWVHSQLIHPLRCCRCRLSCYNETEHSRKRQWHVWACCAHWKSSRQVHELLTTEIRRKHKRTACTHKEKKRESNRSWKEKAEKCNKMSQQDNQPVYKICVLNKWNKSTVGNGIKKRGIRKQRVGITAERG